MTDARRDEVPIVGSIMPGIRLISAADARLTALISGRGPTVILVLPVGVGVASERYLEAHAAEAGKLAAWGARLLVVVTGSPREAEAMVPAAFARNHRVLADPWRKLGAIGPAALVIDEWGEVFFASQAEHVEQLPTPEQLREWAVFVAIQCPECEGPEGDWKRLHDGRDE